MTPLPSFLYGTAWKEEATAGLVEQALAAGFRGIDTANQRKHYHEAGVGEGLAAAYRKGLRREELFLQSKFTSRPGQDARLPYDPQAPPAEQVRQSFESSLRHLGTDRLDGYVLHGPTYRRGLTAEDWEVWGAIEGLHAEGRVGRIGVSNVSAEQLELLCEKARRKPSMVQNRCFAALGWDRDIRSICRREGILYQGFSLLTANAEFLHAPVFHEAVRRTGAGVAAVIFRFAQQVGMLPLTGTTDPDHMREDLACGAFTLSDEEVRRIESVAFEA